MRSGQSASGRTAPRPPQGRAASAVQSVVSKRWFWPAWNGLGAVWGLALWVAALCGIGVIVSAAVHHFQDAGLNGVYEASDGSGEMIFWPNGTYLFSSMGITLPGKYEIRKNDTVNMLAQYKSALHPDASASPDAQVMGSFMGVLASGMAEGAVSADRNTFQWQGTTYSYDHRTTTGPPAVPDPNTTDMGSGGSPSSAASP